MIPVVHILFVFWNNYNLQRYEEVTDLPFWLFKISPSLILTDLYVMAFHL